MFTVEQGQRGVAVLGFLPLPAVLLQEEGRVFLELVQLPEGVVQGEGKSLSLLRQGRVGLTERQAGVGVRQGGPRRGLVRGRGAAAPLGHEALPGTRWNALV